MRTAFVTGATGFLGLHVVEQLTAAGWRVIAYHRPGSELRYLTRYPVERAVGDGLLDRASLERSIPEGADAVFHLAANTSLWSGDREAQRRDNVEGTRTVLRAALSRGVRRFLFTSSASAYGQQHQARIDETAKSTALDSPIHYARTKYLAELEVEAAIGQGLPAVILTPGHVIGRYDTRNWARMILLVERGKLPGIPPGHGTFAWAEAVAKAHVRAVDAGRLGERYLLGGADASYVELVRLIGRLTGKRVPDKALPLIALKGLGRVSEWASKVTRRAPTVTPEIAHASEHSVYLDSAKAVRELGYERVPLGAQLEDAYRWLKAEGLLERAA